MLIALMNRSEKKGNNYNPTHNLFEMPFRHRASLLFDVQTLREGDSRAGALSSEILSSEI